MGGWVRVVPKGVCKREEMGLIVGLCMGHGNTELIRKTEPKLSRTENTVDFLTLSEPNRTGKFFWYGSGSYMLSIPRTVPNCTELKNRN